MLEVEYRKCSVCKESKLLFEFYGKWKVCKACDKERRRKRSQDCREFILNYLLSHPCVDCGEKDPTVLTFDHQHNKKKTLSFMIKSGYSIETLIREIEKCEVRCCNCHARRTAKQQGWFKGI